MTRKDYIIIAGALYNRLEDFRQENYPKGQQDIASAAYGGGFGAAVEAVAFALKRDNPRFDPTRFVNAVTTGEGL